MTAASVCLLEMGAGSMYQMPAACGMYRGVHGKV